MNSTSNHRPALAGAAVSLAFTLVVAMTRPYFHDETSTWFFAADSLPHLWRMLMQDVHPPLYFLIAHGLFQLGLPLFALRVLSAVAMAGAVYLFVRTAGRGALAWPIAAVLATSPFLAFTGYFARYYGLLAFLMVAWGCSLERQRDSVSRSALTGALGSLVALVNYPAGAIVCLGAVVMAWVMRREKRAAALQLLPVLVMFLWLPFLLQQTETEIGGRMEGLGVREFLVGLVRVCGYGVYCLSASDGLPPWTLAGPVVAFAGGALWLRSAVLWLRHGGRRKWFLAVAAGLALVALMGTLAQRGPGFIFFPPRFAWAAFLWYLVLLAVPASDGEPRHPRWLIALLLLMNGIGLGGLMAGGTTNWAYAIPTKEIAGRVAAETANGQTAALYIPRASFGNIVWELQVASGWTGEVNPCAPTVDRVVVIAAAGGEGWPPQEAGAGCAPAGDWVLMHEVRYLREDEVTRRAKQRVMGQASEEHKIILQVYQRMVAVEGAGL